MLLHGSYRAGAEKTVHRTPVHLFVSADAPPPLSALCGRLVRLKTNALVREPDAEALCQWCLSQYMRTTRARQEDDEHRLPPAGW